MDFKRNACYFLIGLFCLVLHNVFGQDQKVADSLAAIYKKDILKDTAKLELLLNLSFNEVNDLKLALHYAEELISLSEQKANNLYLYKGYFLKGNMKKLSGDLEEALYAYFKSIDAAHKADYFKGEANAYGAIAGIYTHSNNHNNAMLYYNKAISTLRQSDDSVALASAILNLGEAFRTNKDYDSAILCFTESGIIFEKVDYLIGKAYNLGNMGMVYASTGEKNLAERNINDAIRILEELGDYYPVCVYLISMSDIHHQKGDKSAALNYALRSLQLAQHYGLKEQISESSLKLSELYTQAGNIGESFKHYKNHVAYRDSINNIESIQKMADLRTDYEISQKQIELIEKEEMLTREKWIRNTFIAAFGIMIFVATMAYRNSKNQKIKNRKITDQKEEIERKNEDLISLNEEKNNLIGIVAHDLKSPVNQIKGLLSLVKMTCKSDDESFKYLDMTEQSTLRLSDMISKILNVEAIESKQLNLVIEKVNFSEVVMANVNRSVVEAARKQIQLCTSITKNVMVNADLSYTDQVIENLLSNAIKFSPPGKNIFINITLHNTVALFEVRDEGPGLSESDKKKLFKKYQKLSATPTGNESSTGLGLSIVKKFVDAMNGEIWCESESGKGASFFVKFNLAT
ncbi:MAG: tetratricopeptide repeat-containing sensor histidine kinase [Chryseolinea sp.]